MPVYEDFSGEKQTKTRRYEWHTERERERERERLLHLLRCLKTNNRFWWLYHLIGASVSYIQPPQLLLLLAERERERRGGRERELLAQRTMNTNLSRVDRYITAPNTVD